MKKNRFYLEIFNVPSDTNQSHLSVQCDSIKEWKLDSIQTIEGSLVAIIHFTTIEPIDFQSLFGLGISVSATNHEINGSNLFLGDFNRDSIQ